MQHVLKVSSSAQAVSTRVEGTALQVRHTALMTGSLASILREAKCFKLMSDLAWDEFHELGATIIDENEQPHVLTRDWYPLHSRLPSCAKILRGSSV